MLQNVLSQLETPLLESGLISKDKIAILLNHLGSYNPNTLLFPGTLKRRLNIPMLDAYKILYQLQIMGVVQRVYEPYCHCCDVFYDQTFKSLKEIPRHACCPQCGSNFNLATDIIVVFEVIV